MIKKFVVWKKDNLLRIWKQADIDSWVYTEREYIQCEGYSPEHYLNHICNGSSREFVLSLGAFTYRHLEETIPPIDIAYLRGTFERRAKSAGFEKWLEGEFKV